MTGKIQPADFNPTRFSTHHIHGDLLSCSVTAIKYHHKLHDEINIPLPAHLRFRSYYWSDLPHEECAADKKQRPTNDVTGANDFSRHHDAWHAGYPFNKFNANLVPAHPPPSAETLLQRLTDAELSSQLPENKRPHSRTDLEKEPFPSTYARSVRYADLSFIQF